MKHDTTSEQAAAVRAAKKPVQEALAELAAERAADEQDRREPEKLAEFLRAELGTFSPRSEPERAKRYAEAKLELELLRPYLDRQIINRPRPALGKLRAAASSLMDRLFEIREPRSELSSELIGNFNRELTSSPEAAARWAIEIADNMLSWRRPQIPANDSWGYGPLPAHAMAWVQQNSTPEPVEQ